MTEQKHTPEPWHAAKPAFGGIVIYSNSTVGGKCLSDGRQHIATMPHEGKKGAIAYHEMFNANARRIVACVNACSGISTENLEQNLPVLELAKRYNDTIRQRDQLRAALDAARPSGDKLNDFHLGQWWVSELQAVAANGTCEQKRAVAVVVNLLNTLDEARAHWPQRRVCDGMATD